MALVGGSDPHGGAVEVMCRSVVMRTVQFHHAHRRGGVHGASSPMSPSFASSSSSSPAAAASSSCFCNLNVVADPLAIFSANASSPLAAVGAGIPSSSLASVSSSSSSSSSSATANAQAFFEAASPQGHLLTLSFAPPFILRNLLAGGIEYQLIARNPLASVGTSSGSTGDGLGGGGGSTGGAGGGSGGFEEDGDGFDDDNDDDDRTMYRRHESMGVRSVKRGVLRRGGRLLWHGCSPDDVVEVRIRLLGIHEAHSNHAMANGGKRGGFGLGFGSSWSSRLYLPPQSIATGDDDPPGRHHREARGGASRGASRQRLRRRRSSSGGWFGLSGNGRAAAGRGGGLGVSDIDYGVGHRRLRVKDAAGGRLFVESHLSVLGATGGDGGVSVAGAGRELQLFVPFWVLNRSQLPIEFQHDPSFAKIRGLNSGEGLAAGQNWPEDGYAQTPSSSSSFSGKRRGDSRSSKAKPLPTFSSKGHGGWGLRDLLASEYSGARFPHLDAPHGGDYGLDDGGAFLDSWHSSGFGGDDDDDDNENDNDWGGFRDLPLMIGASRHDNEGRKGRAGRVGASSSATGARTRLKLRVMDSSHWSPSLDLDGFGGGGGGDGSGTGGAASAATALEVKGRTLRRKRQKRRRRRRLLNLGGPSSWFDLNVDRGRRAFAFGMTVTPVPYPFGRFT